MSRASFAAAPLRARFCLYSLVALALLGTGLSAFAQTGNVVAVEEDWELVLTEPDPDVVAPQVTCAMAPNANFKIPIGRLRSTI
jgi:hypothetical protein